MDGCLAWLLCMLLPTVAMADGANTEWNSTTRSLSMGNVGIASAEDPATAMFYNPAALARAKRPSLEFFSPQFDIGTGVFGLGGSADLGKHFSLEKSKELLERRPGKVSYLGFSLYPNFSARNFSFGVLAKAEGGAYVHQGELRYRSRYLVIPTLGMSFGTLSGRFRLGFAVRAIQLTENQGKSLVTAPAAYTLNADEGFGLGVDGGALITMPWTYLPTIGIVARNIGGTRFSGAVPFSVSTGTSARKETMKMMFDAGFSFFPKTGKRSGLTFAVDYRDILNSSGINIKRRINLGIEFSFNQMFYLRTGFGQGYWTAGVGVATKQGSLDLGTYAEEWDSTGFQGKQDRRISLRYGSRF